MALKFAPTDAELFVGIVARIGVDTKQVVAALERELKEYRYRVHEIKVTVPLKAFEGKFELRDRPIEARYDSYIKACNQIRNDIDYNVMAKLALIEIKSRRSQEGNPENTQQRIAYIINQIKRPEEAELLSLIYGEQYVQISCHANSHIRVKRLQNLISNDHPESPKNRSWEIRARELVARDESEEEKASGQRVRQVFPLSDLILNATTAVLIDKGITRFLRALFEDAAVSPSRDEYGMQLANVA